MLSKCFIAFVANLRRREKTWAKKKLMYKLIPRVCAKLVILVLRLSSEQEALICYYKLRIAFSNHIFPPSPQKKK